LRQNDRDAAPNARALLRVLDRDDDTAPETKAAAHAHVGNFYVRRACPTEDKDEEATLRREADLRSATEQYAAAGRDKRVLVRGWRGALPAFHWITALCSLGEAVARKAVTTSVHDASMYLQLALDYFLQAKALAQAFSAMPAADFDDGDDQLHTKFDWFHDAVLRHLFHAALNLHRLRSAYPLLVKVDPRFDGIIHVALQGKQENRI